MSPAKKKSSSSNIGASNGETKTHVSPPRSTGVKRKHSATTYRVEDRISCMKLKGVEKEQRMKENMEKMDAIKESVEKEALETFRVVMPNDVQRLHDLYESVKANQLKKSVSCKPPGSDGLITVPDNKYIEDLYFKLRKEIMRMVVAFVKMRFWLQLKMPKLQTGNNMAAAVAEELLLMYESGRVSGLSVLEIVAKYFLRRASMVQKFHKTPNTNISDRVREIADLDEKQYICLVQGAMGLRNTYALVYDKMEKNFDFIERLGRDNDGGEVLMTF